MGRIVDNLTMKCVTYIFSLNMKFLGIQEWIGKNWDMRNKNRGRTSQNNFFRLIINDGLVTTPKREAKPFAEIFWTNFKFVFAIFWSSSIWYSRIPKHIQKNLKKVDTTISLRLNELILILILTNLFSKNCGIFLNSWKSARTVQRKSSRYLFTSYRRIQ